MQTDNADKVVKLLEEKLAQKEAELVKASAENLSLQEYIQGLSQTQKLSRSEVAPDAIQRSNDALFDHVWNNSKRRQQEVRKLVADLNTFKSQCQALEQVSKAEMASHLKMTSELRQAKEANRLMQQQLDRLGVEKQDNTVARAVLQQERDDIGSQNLDLKKAIALAVTRAEEAEQTSANTSKRLRSTQSDLKSRTKLFLSLQEQMDQLTLQHQQQHSSLALTTSQLAESQKKFKDFSEETGKQLGDLMQQLTVARAELSSYRATKEEQLAEQEAKLNTAVSLGRQLTEEVEGLRQELTREKSLVAQLQTQLSAAQGALSSSEHKLAGVQQQLEEELSKEKVQPEQLEELRHALLTAEADRSKAFALISERNKAIVDTRKSSARLATQALTYKTRLEQLGKPLKTLQVTKLPDPYVHGFDCLVQKRVGCSASICLSRAPSTGIIYVRVMAEDLSREHVQELGQVRFVELKDLPPLPTPNDDDGAENNKDETTQQPQHPDDIDSPRSAKPPASAPLTIAEGGGSSSHRAGANSTAETCFSPASPVFPPFSTNTPSQLSMPPPASSSSDPTTTTTTTETASTAPSQQTLAAASSKPTSTSRRSSGTPNLVLEPTTKQHKQQVKQWKKERASKWKEIEKAEKEAEKKYLRFVILLTADGADRLLFQCPKKRKDEAFKTVVSLLRSTAQNQLPDVLPLPAMVDTDFADRDIIQAAIGFVHSPFTSTNTNNVTGASTPSVQTPSKSALSEYDVSDADSFNLNFSGLYPTTPSKLLDSNASSGVNTPKRPEGSNTIATSQPEANPSPSFASSNLTAALTQQQKKPNLVTGKKSGKAKRKVVLVAEPEGN